MTPPLRTTLISATLLLFAACIGAVLVGGTDLGGGVASAGGLVLVNFVLWVWVGRALFASALSGQSPVKAAAIWGGKFALLIGGLLFLLTTFPPASVAVGASVVVAALMLQAFASTASLLRIEEDAALRAERTA